MLVSSRIRKWHEADEGTCYVNSRLVSRNAIWIYFQSAFSSPGVGEELIGGLDPDKRLGILLPGVRESPMVATGMSTS